MFTKLTNSVRKFHRDEEGLEALQVVMIIAIAAIVMIACAALGKKGVAWMKKQWTAMEKKARASSKPRQQTKVVVPGQAVRPTHNQPRPPGSFYK